MLNKRSGISLIVLVITIIIMIILATVIILSLDSSNIIERANEAKDKANLANAKEVVALAKAEWELDNEKLSTEYADVTEYVYSKLEEAGYKTEGNDAISISASSNAINKVYIGSDDKQAIIPEGFKVSSIASEDTVTEGLVIIDDEGNEFVWVPVDDMTKFTLTTTYDGTITTPGDESDVYTEPCSTLATLSSINDLTGEYAEYNKMRTSVQSNKGFYIGRYETGTTLNRTYEENGTTDVVVQKNKPVYNFVGWGPNGTDVTGDVIVSNKNQGKGAVELSRNMYKTSTSVSSTLCYGVQWDATMYFMKDISNPNVSEKIYVEDSTGMGVYETGQVATTGSNDAYKVKNIYDMAGNVYEWTMESCLATGATGVARITRGGDFNLDAVVSPASSRYSQYANNIYESNGFRIALYIK